MINKIIVALLFLLVLLVIIYLSPAVIQCINNNL